jgi:3D (Asp-Asp-Asp) domain-containing protein
LASGILESIDIVGKAFLSIICFWAIISFFACSQPTNSIEVTATAYTSTAGETDSTPTLTAWGDTLKPGMKAIAVSRDLIEMGLSQGVKVLIDGLDGKYTVLDKMDKRWDRKIDIYMGTDVEKAKEWGEREVVISWE